MNLGVRAHDINKHSVEELVQEVKSKGLHAVQLALPKSFDYIGTELGTVTPGLAHYIGRTFRENNLQIAVLGCYINTVHPDLNVRRKEIERFKEYIRYAREFGCSVIGTETGTIIPGAGYTTENHKEEVLDMVVETIRELVAEAEKFGVVVGLEAALTHPIHSIETMKKVLDRIDSNNLQVIFDPVNLMKIDNYQNQEEIFSKAFEWFGEKIAIIHVKDFVIEDNSVKVVPIGKGLLNYDFVMKLIKDRKPHINFLMEDQIEPFIDESIAYLKEKYEQA
ncbi:sugar phosphate isomerase/epimerase family protein [Halalkalibacter urbisdiaboli]|uniref:sugar phosphate isomerase/epimerase family protein n=1 Tax=Halalkalibacter urbisdiaboli TaxID=1960589 RepID=UPI000B450C8C|nr:sugar phosphate isomerase/epimerase family protein [Halalkalibacter urbisdiaboli]